MNEKRDSPSITAELSSQKRCGESEKSSSKAASASGSTGSERTWTR
jgi:hypothetical protein